MADSGTGTMCITDIIRPLINCQYFLLISMGYLLCVMAICLLILAVCLTLLAVLVRQQKPHLLAHLREPDADGQCPLVVGLFHPYCNAGGGGERVLWVAIRALYTRYPNVKCVVYTGDTDVTGEEIMARARQRFNFVPPRPVEFVFLERRMWVEASRYPYFTLLGQSLGSMVLGMEALTKFVPDIYIDTMGYAFTVPLFRYLGGCHVACYVHYPTISTDMLTVVAQRTASHNNAGFIVRSPVLSALKMCYYRLFAYIYGVVGSKSQIVMVNSSWTEGHIRQIWGANDRTHVVFPPCDTKEFLSIPLTDTSTNKTHLIVSVAQFRPEKDHPLQIRSFKEFLAQQSTGETNKYKLVLVGSCRNEEDCKRVESLREMAKGLGLEEQVEFRLNVSFAELKKSMEDATIGIHTMWNEHFGIGVVELMAAGTVTLAHNSGGPKLDIVVPHNGSPTGYLADSAATYADALNQIFSLTKEESMELRRNARESVKRFSEDEFEQGFIAATEPLFVT